jgi:hypothetical protein
MSKCVICDHETDRPVREFFWHFRLVEWDQWRFWRGNIKMFGFWSGLKSSITLSFPIINTLWHWKYRKARLVFPKWWTP